MASFVMRNKLLRGNIKQSVITLVLKVAVLAVLLILGQLSEKDLLVTFVHFHTDWGFFISDWEAAGSHPYLHLRAQSLS